MECVTSAVVEVGLAELTGEEMVAVLVDLLLAMVAFWEGCSEEG